MEFDHLYVSQAPRYALSRRTDTQAPLLSIPVANFMVEYEEWYTISEEELQLFLADREAAADFARSCGRRKQDERLLLKPGSQRGWYTE